MLLQLRELPGLAGRRAGPPCQHGAARPGLAAAKLAQRLREPERAWHRLPGLKVYTGRITPCVTCGKFSNRSVPPFPPLLHGDDSSAYSVRIKSTKMIKH